MRLISLLLYPVNGRFRPFFYFDLKLCSKVDMNILNRGISKLYLAFDFLFEFGTNLLKLRIGEVNRCC